MELETNASDGQQNDTSQISADIAFTILKNQRRRFALHYLKEQSRPVKLSELAEQVAAWEEDTTVDSLPSKKRKSVYTSLYQSHLPKLADAGVIDYNRDRGVVALTESAPQLEDYLNVTASSDAAWSNYYLGAALVGASLVAASWLDVPPISSMPSHLWGGVIITLFLLVTLAFAYSTYQNRPDGPAHDDLPLHDQQRSHDD